MSNVLEFRQAHKACLNDLQIARLQAGERPDATSQAHMETCERCQTALQNLRVATDAAKVERVPGYMQQNERAWWSRFRLQGIQAWGMAGVAAAVLLAIALPRTQPLRDAGPDVLAKGGSVELLFTVQRHGQFVYEDVNASNMKLEDGDHLRLRVVGRQGAFVTVRARSDEENQTLFTGVLPDDGFLPDGLRYTPGPATRLDVSVCVRAPVTAQDEAACTQRSATF